MYAEISRTLQRAYDDKVGERDASGVESWKDLERHTFLQQLETGNCPKLLEVGAGTGKHGAWFKDRGMEVVSTDLSAEMVAACRRKGLEAYQMDFLSLDFPDASFDAVFALNCFLHVPRTHLPQVLANVARLLRPGGLFYWGQYGGENFEGTFEWDNYSPKRFFASLADDDMKELGAEHFELLDFHTVKVSRQAEHFQSGTYRLIN